MKVRIAGSLLAFLMLAPALAGCGLLSKANRGTVGPFFSPSSGLSSQTAVATRSIDLRISEGTDLGIGESYTLRGTMTVQGSYVVRMAAIDGPLTASSGVIVASGGAEVGEDSITIPGKPLYEDGTRTLKMAPGPYSIFVSCGDQSEILFATFH